MCSQDSWRWCPLLSTSTPTLAASEKPLETPRTGSSEEHACAHTHTLTHSAVQTIPHICHVQCVRNLTAICLLDVLRWRTKQNLDYSYLMLYAQDKGTYYVQVGPVFFLVFGSMSILSACLSCLSHLLTCLSDLSVLYCLPVCSAACPDITATSCVVCCQLEDDIVAKPKYSLTMKDCASQRANQDWLFLEFSQLGFIG